MSEEWRIIPGFPAYAASSDGRVKRIAATPRYRVTGKVLNSNPGPAGYIIVSLYRDGEHHSRSVHSIVCETFHGPRPTPDHQACHNDGTRTNNRADNLRWDDRAGNMTDKDRHGTMPRGGRHHSKTRPECVARGERNGGGGKLTVSDVRAIRCDNRANREVARQYGVAPSMISMIKRRQSWKHVA